MLVKKLLMLLLILLAGGWFVAEVAAKNFAERSLSENVRSKDPAAKDATAKVSSPLLWGLITKSNIEKIVISTSHVTVGPFIADRTSATLLDVHLDRAASIQESEPIVDRIRRLEMLLEISDDEVSKSLPRGLSVEFTEGKVILHGPGGLSIDGTIEVVTPDQIRFKPSGSLPRGLSAPSWKLEDIPLVSCLQRIALTPGLITVTCSQDNPPPRFPPR